MKLPPRVSEAWPVFQLWLRKDVPVDRMDGPPGCTDRYSIDDVMDMTDALDEWEAAERRIRNRNHQSED